MAKAAMSSTLLAILTVIISVMVSSTAANWAESVAVSKEEKPSNQTTLQFYFHDTLSGKNPSAVRVAQGADTDKSPTIFGDVFMADDPLTETPDINSKLVGRAQGLYGSSGQQELRLIMGLSFSFIDGSYNGSTISIFGKNTVTHKIRELPVVGGTRIFRSARGYAIANTYSLKPNGDAIVGYNLAQWKTRGATKVLPNTLEPCGMSKKKCGMF